MSNYADLIERLVEGKSSYIDPLARDLWNRDGFAARDAISRLERENAELRAALEAMIPNNVALGNPLWPGSTVIPIDVTLGELRAARKALSRTQEQTA